MAEYICDACRGECGPQLLAVGLSASCCYEARLLIQGDDGPRELSFGERYDLIETLWFEQNNP